MFLCPEATGASGAAATFSATASDIVSGVVPVVFNATSGATFALGNTTVSASATDAAGNTAAGAFTITVRDTTPAVITTPADIVREATGPAGAVVTFAASATDLVDGNVAVTPSKASGSTFALGTTTVTLSAPDAANNASAKTFTVTVRDTTAPAITVPANINVDSTTVLGTAVTFSVSATDIVNGTRVVTLSKASGTVFPIGATTVTATTSDVAGNTATKSFTVTVRAPASAVVNRLGSNNGMIVGSIQQLEDENVTLNGGAQITGEMLVVGTPTLRKNGNPSVGGTVDGTGSASPSNYEITLNGNASLGKLVRRMDAITMPTVAAPSTPTGTRSVSMNKASDPIGAWSTLKNLTLNGNVTFHGYVTAPSGTVTINGNSELRGGLVADRLVLNGNSKLTLLQR